MAKGRRFLMEYNPGTILISRDSNLRSSILFSLADQPANSQVTQCSIVKNVDKIVNESLSSAKAEQSFDSIAYVRFSINAI